MAKKIKKIVEKAKAAKFQVIETNDVANLKGKLKYAFIYLVTMTSNDETSSFLVSSDTKGLDKLKTDDMNDSLVKKLSDKVFKLSDVSDVVVDYIKSLKRKVDLPLSEVISEDPTILDMIDSSPVDVKDDADNDDSSDDDVSWGDSDDDTADNDTSIDVSSAEAVEA